jgi:hypothetical protein
MSFLIQNNRGMGRSFQAASCIFHGRVFVNGQEMNTTEPLEEAKRRHCKVTVILEYEDAPKLEQVSHFQQAPHTFVIEVRGNASQVDSASADVHVHGDVHGSVSSASGNVEVKGLVQGNASAMSGDVNVGGAVHGHANSMSGDVRCAEVRQGAVGKALPKKRRT